jgi:hypothetical protein
LSGGAKALPSMKRRASVADGRPTNVRGCRAQVAAADRLSLRKEARAMNNTLELIVVLALTIVLIRSL